MGKRNGQPLFLIMDIVCPHPSPLPPTPPLPSLSVFLTVVYLAHVPKIIKQEMKVFIFYVTTQS